MRRDVGPALWIRLRTVVCRWRGHCWQPAAVAFWGQRMPGQACRRCGQWEPG